MAAASLLVSTLHRMAGLSHYEEGRGNIVSTLRATLRFGGPSAVQGVARAALESLEEAVTQENRAMERETDREHRRFLGRELADINGCRQELRELLALPDAIQGAAQERDAAAGRCSGCASLAARIERTVKVLTKNRGCLDAARLGLAALKPNKDGPQ